ncbi:glycoside hydrolase family 13 protein [Terrabacter sp. MAHUQ-38]|uniref:glycoside hydrolase family 13 protein n=1 Tax=unclassified Terrabacter TaxID=2630222 RepID=UPI00165DD662|nr:glycoside hydrolase family 13 protein [Terrabacter sp. MAHUQ-38]MBC9822158.1 glycoside hydrolase family 13 protein [Terrabacter sp. MAHUQ-38]
MPAHRSATTPTSDWWRQAVIYQIYPRSFADADGDGIGDLPGIRSRLDYLSRLGIDAIWLSPFYPSPLADGGYDITDHRDVDPRLGTLDDFDALVADAHQRGVRIIIDIVPNHTSDRHPWFLEAVAAGPGSPARERYIFRDGSGPDGREPPSDWRSHFGGPAWHRTADGQWYCHLFAREQPDLNWAHPEVRDYFEDTLRFWADRGVDGFRIDVAHSLAKDLSSPLRSQPNLDGMLPLDGSDPLYDRDEVHEIYRSWRRIFDEYDPPRMAVAETWHPTSSRTYLYARADELGQIFDFSLLKADWHPDQFRTVISRSLGEHAGVGGALTWVVSSHDVPRHATRYALPVGTDLDAWLRSDGTHFPLDEATAQRRARAATVMMLALPGSAYLYQGEELGLLEVADLPVDALQDPVYERTGHRLKGRDGCRVPLPWTVDGSSFGFGNNGAWLPQPDWFATYAASSQDGHPGSSLELYRRAITLRRKLADTDGFCWVDSGDAQVLRFARAEDWQCIVNFSAHTVPIPGRLILTSDPAGIPDRTGQSHTLRPETAAWFTPMN